MADATTVVHIGENSPEQIAHRLMREIATVEGKSFTRNPSDGWQIADRKWILDTFAECIRAVHGNRLIK